MAKRSASNQLTKDNCEEDDPVEEVMDILLNYALSGFNLFHQAGHFIIASREELARRPIKTARRKLADSTGTTVRYDIFLLE